MIGLEEIEKSLLRLRTSITLSLKGTPERLTIGLTLGMFKLVKCPCLARSL